MTVPVATRFPIGVPLAGGRWTIEERLHGCPERGVYRAAGEGRVLVTMGLRQGRFRAHAAATLALPSEGIAPLLAITRTLDVDGVPFDAIAEAEPDGAPLTEWPVDEPRVVARGLATIVARAHDAGLVIGVIRPELVYAEGDRCTGIAPRAETFLAAAPYPPEGVPQCFDTVYSSPEALLAAPTTAASDVFSLCATLVYLLEGAPPFDGKDIFERMVSAIHGRVRGQRIDGTILAGLSTNPVDRPSSAEIASVLDT